MNEQLLRSFRVLKRKPRKGIYGSCFYGLFFTGIKFQINIQFDTILFPLRKFDIPYLFQWVKFNTPILFRRRHTTNDLGPFFNDIRSLTFIICGINYQTTNFLIALKDGKDNTNYAGRPWTDFLEGKVSPLMIFFCPERERNNEVEMKFLGIFRWSSTSEDRFLDNNITQVVGDIISWSVICMGSIEKELLIRNKILRIRFVASSL